MVRYSLPGGAGAVSAGAGAASASRELAGGLALQRPGRLPGIRRRERLELGREPPHGVAADQPVRPDADDRRSGRWQPPASPSRRSRPPRRILRSQAQPNPARRCPGCRSPRNSGRPSPEPSARQHTGQCPGWPSQPLMSPGYLAAPAAACGSCPGWQQTTGGFSPARPGRADPAPTRPGPPPSAPRVPAPCAAPARRASGARQPRGRQVARRQRRDRDRRPATEPGRPLRGRERRRSRSRLNYLPGQFSGKERPRSVMPGQMAPVRGAGQAASADSGGLRAQRIAWVIACPAGRTSAVSVTGRYGRRSGRRAQPGSSDVAAAARMP